MKEIYADEYNWEQIGNDGDSPFGMMTVLGNRYSVGDVNIIRSSLNKVGFYGFGGIHPTDDAAVELNDGCVLYCIVSGKENADTFQSGSDIKMRYYILTPISK